MNQKSLLYNKTQEYYIVLVSQMLVLFALLIRTNFEMSGQKWLVFDVIFFLELAAL